MNEKCPDCGYNYSLFGRVHRCRPPKDRMDGMANVKSDMANPVANRLEELANAPYGAAKEVLASKTYQYRNEEKRREYMKEYMRRKRARGK